MGRLPHLRHQAGRRRHRPPSRSAGAVRRAPRGALRHPATRWRRRAPDAAGSGPGAVPQHLEAAGAGPAHRLSLGLPSDAGAALSQLHRRRRRAAGHRRARPAERPRHLGRRPAPPGAHDRAGRRRGSARLQRSTSTRSCASCSASASRCRRRRTIPGRRPQRLAGRRAPGPATAARRPRRAAQPLGADRGRPRRSTCRWCATCCCRPPRRRSPSIELDDRVPPASIAGMVLATAWKESCWRQFVKVGGRISPIRSAGRLGRHHAGQPARLARLLRRSRGCSRTSPTTPRAGSRDPAPLPARLRHRQGRAHRHRQASTTSPAPPTPSTTAAPATCAATAATRPSARPARHRRRLLGEVPEGQKGTGDGGGGMLRAVRRAGDAHEH